MANLFSKESNLVPIKILLCKVITVILIVIGITYYFTPKYTRVGYQPTQPVSFDHSLHAGQLGLDCRYCHSFGTVSSHSNVPTTQTCMNCHRQVKANSPKLAPLRESWETGKPMKWIKIHQAPDYVYFNHSAHVNRGISCASCHGKINEMEVVWHDKNHSMGWCLECHRNPEYHIRPQEEVFNLNWKAGDGSTKAQLEQGRELVQKWKVQPPQNCQACHR